jgi:major membrane immunogen (membrane-anchored lipoprotein)
MKNISFLFAAFLVLISCENKPENFRGVGEFRIGENFISSPVFKSFTKIMDDEFNARRYKLSDKIGYVSDLNITTEDGKITEVKFSSNEQTSVKELEKTFENLTEMKAPTKQKAFSKAYKMPDMKFYTTKDSSIFLSIISYQGRSLRNGRQQIEYSYISREATMKKINQTLKRLNIKTAPKR